MRQNIDIDALEISREGMAIVDIGNGVENQEDRWAVLLNKGCTGIDGEIRGITPSKKSQGGILSACDNCENENKASDRVVVENVSGRQSTLWCVVSNMYRWSENSYDFIFRLTRALTNLHIRWHPLRDTDGKPYERYAKRLHEIAETGVWKRQRAQTSYCKRRRRALERWVRNHEGEENVGNV